MVQNQMSASHSSMSVMSATLYNWHNSFFLKDQRADIEYFSRSCSHYGPNVLVGGCGTGRVAGPLRALGYSVTGIDSDPARLAIGSRSYPHLRLIRADLKTFRIAKPFDLVILPYSTAQLFSPGKPLNDLVETMRNCAKNWIIVDISDNFARRTDCDWHLVLRASCKELSSEVAEWQKWIVRTDHLHHLSRFILTSGPSVEVEERWYFHSQAELVSAFSAGGLECAKVDCGYGQGVSRHRHIYHFRKV
jgi:trans-aconitate methyltransferase